jgi:uroporphyrinogen decarboxylase
MNKASEKILNQIMEAKTDPEVECLQTALSLSGEPDRVPLMELFADGEVMATILNKPLNYFSKELRSRDEWEDRMHSLIEFYETLGYDYVRADTRGYEATRKAYRFNRTIHNAGDFGSRAYRHKLNDVALEMSRGERLWANEDTGVIGDWNDFHNYPWENPETIQEEGCEGLDYICDNVPTGMGVVTGAGSILEPVMWLMGFRNFYVSIYKQRDLVDAMFEKVREISLARFELAAKASRNIAAFWGSDDWGYRDGLMISPTMMKRWVFPVHKRMAEIAHARGSLYVLHSCGNLEVIRDEIINDIQVDAKHSFEDNYRPVTEAKRLYGHRIGLIGGVDMDVLTRRTPHEVESYVNHILEECKPGGGYCLGTGNTVANYLPLENYLTMINVGHAKGWYS